MEKKSSKLTIAFISYEFPPETGSGGIGTYLNNIKAVLEMLGHVLFVFCGESPLISQHESEPGVVRIPCVNWDEFNEKVTDVFANYHQKYHFQIIEGTDFRACGFYIKKRFPEIPYVIRLHTPNFLADQLNYKTLYLSGKIRFILGGILRGRINIPPSFPDDYVYPKEIENLKIADCYLTPSISIYERLKKHCNSTKPVKLVPFPFELSQNNSERKFDKIRIVFAGRLEKRKGIIEFLEALCLIKRQLGGAEIIIAGADGGIKREELERRYIKARLKSLDIKLCGGISNSELKLLFSSAHIAVFPSYWESFGIVIFEAMSSGCCVVTTTGSAPEEYLKNEYDAILVKPKSIKDLSRAILKVLDDDVFRKKIAANALNTIKEEFNPEKVGARQAIFYKEVIESFS